MDTRPESPLGERECPCCRPFAGVLLGRFHRRGVRVLNFAHPGRKVALGPLLAPGGRLRIGPVRFARALSGALQPPSPWPSSVPLPLKGRFRLCFKAP